MFDSQATNSPPFEFSSWRQRSNNMQQQTNVFGYQLDAPFTCSTTFNTIPRIDPLSNAGSISIIDRVIDREPQAIVVDHPSPNVVPIEKHSELDDAQQHTESTTTDKEDNDDDDMWMSVSYDNAPEEDRPLTWEAHEPGKRFLTEMPPECYESIYQRFVQRPFLLIREEQLVESLVQALCGQPSICFRWNMNMNIFEPRAKDIRILGVSSSTLDQVIQRLLIFATQMRRLERVSRHCKANPSYYGLTGTAFACCLGDLHIRFQHSIWTIFKSLSDVTVMTVYHSVRTLAETVDNFARMIHLDGSVPEHHALSASAIEHLSKFGFYIPFGKDLLVMIHKEVLAHDLATTGDTIFYRDICLAILCHTSIPYITMLNQWLGLTGRATINGEAILDWDDIVDESPLHDPYGEFFLRASTKPVGGSHQWTIKTVTAPGNHSDSFIQRYRLRKEDNLPYFVDKVQANVILRTGCALHLLRRFQPGHPLCALDDSTLRLRWSMNEAQYNEHTKELRDFANIVRQYNTQHQSMERRSRSLSPTQSGMNEMHDNETSTSSTSIPSLQPLNELEFVNDFSRTLDRIMSSHTSLNPDHFIPTLEIIVNQSIHRPLQIWCPLVNESALRLFTHQFHIEDHFRLLQQFYLFGDANFRASLMNMLLMTDEEGCGVRMHGDQWPPRASALNMSLKAVLLESIAQIPEQVKERICKPIQEQQQTAVTAAMHLDDLLSFGVRDTLYDSPWIDPRAITALDFLFLSYHVPYPISLIISPRILEKYNRLFTFLLQVHRVNAASKHAFTRLAKTSSSANDTLHRMRFQIDQFITTFSNYIFDTAVHATWHTFMQQVRALCDDEGERTNDSSNPFTTMDPLMMAEYHEHILDRMLYQCFLKQSLRAVHGIIHKIFQDVLAFSSVVDNIDDDDAADTCIEIHAAFSQHAEQFAKVLGKLHDRGIGRLGNVMNSYHDHGNFGRFGDFYDKQEARSDQGAFARELLTRLDINGFYDKDDHPL